MLWALAFLPLFGIGGLTGIPLAFSAADIYLHDTYYIIAHFHYVIAPGTMFALFAGIAHWYPKATGRMMSEFWGKVHFWPTMVLMNCIFFPMFLQGMAGMHRRMSDGGATYLLNANVLSWNLMNTVSPEKKRISAPKPNRLFPARKFRPLIRKHHGSYPVHRSRSTGHWPIQCQAGHLAVPSL
jgi:heme/copper-type cytochrome/quinol oxidase subunit 1